MRKATKKTTMIVLWILLAVHGACALGAAIALWEITRHA